MKESVNMERNIEYFETKGKIIASYFRVGNKPRFKLELDRITYNGRLAIPDTSLDDIGSKGELWLMTRDFGMIMIPEEVVRLGQLMTVRWPLHDRPFIPLEHILDNCAKV